MAYDPLSRSTRVARTTFLIIGTSAVVVSALRIKLGQIQGLEIPFPETTMNAVLVVATAYTLFAFLIAYVDDLRQLEATPRERARLERLRTRRQKLTELYDRIQVTHPNAVDTARFLAEPELLRELQVLDNFYALAEADGPRLQEVWNRCRAAATSAAVRGLKRIDAEQSKTPPDRWSDFRLYVIDGFVPCLVFCAALAGWIGGLDWVAPLLEAESGAAPQ